MRMDVDGACHDDLAGGVIGLLGQDLALGRVDDSAVAKPHVAQSIASMGRIDDVTAPDARQQGKALSRGSAETIWLIAWATDIAPLLLAAGTRLRVPVWAIRSTASWSTPGRPTAMR